MIDAFLYFSGDTGIGLDVIADELESALGEAGKVTGSGSGTSGANIDLRLDDRLPPDKALKLFREVLTLLGVQDARIVLGSREYRFP
jgi:hypothetical protein